MGRWIHKSIHEYLSKIKKHTLTPTSTSCLLSACKHPRTLSFSADRAFLSDYDQHRSVAATLSDIDRFMFENFNSIYSHDSDVDEGDEKRIDSLCSPAYPDMTPEVKASQRFFFSPGWSGSLVDEALLTTSSSSVTGVAVPDDGMAVMTFTKDPYEDFRRSMQEMVDARGCCASPDDPSGRLDWEFMEDLLFCYLELNDRSVHKYILGAFTDLTSSLRPWKLTT